jgi:sec-independent protein translocase protein TatA
MGIIPNGDLFIILLLILILFGPKKIPAIMRSLGAGVRELKRASREATEEFNRLTTTESEPPQAPAFRPEAHPTPEDHPDPEDLPGEKTV